MMLQPYFYHVESALLLRNFNRPVHYLSPVIRFKKGAPKVSKIERAISEAGNDMSYS